MKTHGLSLLLIALLGCGAQEGASTTDAPSDSGIAGSPQSSTDEASPHLAKSAEELVAAYQAAFERGDREAIKSMVYWEGIPEDHRDWNLRAIFAINYADGVHGKIRAAEVVDPPTEGRFRPEDLSLPATKMLEGSYEGDGGGGDLRIPIGELNGNFYFCARKPVS